MSQIDGVIFDVDGTLVDSERDGHRVAFNRAFEEEGLPDRWDPDLYGDLLVIAGGDRRMAHWFQTQGRAEDKAWELARRLHPRKSHFMREIVESGSIQPRPGTVELMALLRARGVPIHVATTGQRSWVEAVLALFGPVFDTVVTGTEVPNLKPEPDAYLEVLRRAGLAADRAVAVEDSENGVRAAAAAGIPCVATYNDYTRDHDLAGAAVVAETLEDPQVASWLQTRLPTPDTGS